MRNCIAFVVLGMALVWSAGCGKRSTTISPPKTFPAKAQLSMAGVQVALEVVADEESLRRGLMFRDSLAPNSGMLFVFPREGIYPFWMKNTRIPLSIAFLDRRGRVVGLDEMEPFDTVTLHQPQEPFLYAVEMRPGWFSDHKLRVGDTIELPPLMTLTPQ